MYLSGSQNGRRHSAELQRYFPALVHSCLSLLYPKPHSPPRSLAKCQLFFQEASPLYQFISPPNNLEINNVATGERLKSHLVNKPKLSLKYLQHQKEMSTQRARAGASGPSQLSI